MLCQKCHERQATVFFTQTVNQETTQSHLCEVCAKEQTQLYGGVNPLNFNPFAALSNLLTQVMGMQANAVPGGTLGRTNPASTEPQIQCPHCGYQLSVFRQTGRLGCTRCYESFKTALEPLISSIHGKGRHVDESGLQSPRETQEIATESAPVTADKSKASNKKADPVEAKVKSLRDRIKEAIQNEKFEEAAKLRDEIKKIEGK